MKKSLNHFKFKFDITVIPNIQRAWFFAEFFEHRNFTCSFLSTLILEKIYMLKKENVRACSFFSACSMYVRVYLNYRKLFFFSIFFSDFLKIHQLHLVNACQFQESIIRKYCKYIKSAHALKKLILFLKICT